MTHLPPNDYDLQITAISGGKDETFTVTLRLVDPCPDATMTLNESNGVFRSENYVLRDNE